MLDFVVSRQELKRVDSNMIVSDTIDYITARFRFSGDWAGLTKHALFEKGTDTYDITLTDNAITESDSCNLTDGTWLLSVVGVEIVDAVVTQRITTQQIELSVTASGNTSGEPFPPSSGSDLYLTLNQTTPQTIIDGVPLLASDRTINADNQITDKKYVDDKVATVTADDFNHNDLANKQGGTSGEYYHMTQEQSVVLEHTSGENTGDQSASDFDHGGLTGLQGGSEFEHYHMTEAEHAALHAHSNKEALDATSGTNTGDQSADEFNHNDLANKQGGTTNEFYHVTAAEKTVIQNTSGTNTGDQMLPTRDSLGLDIDDTVTFANLSGTNTGDQDVSGAISTHNTDAGAHGGAFALHYTFRWDKVNALGVRLNNAQGISTTITNFCHRGTENAAMDNPFDSIYPWKDRNVCNISIDAYRALTSGASLSDCIISWLGDPDFDYAHVNGAWVYTPEFWYKVWDEGGYRYFDISPIAIAGYIHAPEAIEGRWYGGIYTLTVDGTSKSCLLPKPGMPGKNVAVSTLHTYAKNWGASVEDIYSYSATDVLMIVEFATMNTQTAIGNGVSDLYRQRSDTIQADATTSATVKVLTAAAGMCISGSIFDIGTTNEAVDIGSFIIASTAPDADPTYTIVTLTTDGSTPASVTVTTDHMWSVHGLSNTEDASIGAASGYIGTNGKSHAYYRGQVSHANMYRYILGTYRQTATGNIWIANSSAEADGYDALNTGVHKDTGLTLPQGEAGAEIGGYIGSLHLCPDVPAAPFCGTIGGSNANPIGDYCFVPTLATANTILIAGGNANSGAACGRFFGSWNYSAATSSWRIGALPVLKTPV